MPCLKSCLIQSRTGLTISFAPTIDIAGPEGFKFGAVLARVFDFTQILLTRQLPFSIPRNTPTCRKMKSKQNLAKFVGWLSSTPIVALDRWSSVRLGVCIHWQTLSCMQLIHPGVWVIPWETWQENPQDRPKALYKINTCPPSIYINRWYDAGRDRAESHLGVALAGIKGVNLLRSIRHKTCHNIPVMIVFESNLRGIV